jgi:hypothetical protein
MGVRENKVETYLNTEVKRVFDGETRKWVSPGRDGVPDRILFISGFPAIFVEVKTNDGRLSGVQIREHQRLTDTKTTSMFTTIYGRSGVDTLIRILSNRLELEKHVY